MVWTQDRPDSFRCIAHSNPTIVRTALVDLSFQDVVEPNSQPQVECTQKICTTRNAPHNPTVPVPPCSTFRKMPRESRCSCALVDYATASGPGPAAPRAVRSAAQAQRIYYVPIATQISEGHGSRLGSAAAEDYTLKVKVSTRRRASGGD